jgi:hypothetical protein
MKRKAGGAHRMGRAAGSKKEQLKYLKNRIRLLSQVAESLGEDADAQDLANVLKMLKDLTIKVERFHEDWKD